MSARDDLDEYMREYFDRDPEFQRLVDEVEIAAVRRAAAKQRAAIADLKNAGPTGHSLWLILGEHTDRIDPDGVR